MWLRAVLNWGPLALQSDALTIAPRRRYASLRVQMYSAGYNKYASPDLNIFKKIAKNSKIDESLKKRTPHNNMII